MPFSKSVKEEALVKARRHCCVCHEFAGLYVNVHHIVPETDGGKSEIENAIVLCLRCHGEAGHYNLRHPMGNKYSLDELLRHRHEWFKWCEQNPYTPLPKEPITVSPPSIEFVNREWTTHASFKINNKTDEILYQVCVKITFNTHNIEFEDIDINIINSQKDENSVQVQDVMINNHILKFLGRDKSGSKIIYLRIACLEPREVYTFSIKNRLSNKSDDRYTGRLSIGDFTKEPHKTITMPGKVAILFSKPKDIIVEKIGFLVWKTD
jgi:hypothetical protein